MRPSQPHSTTSLNHIDRYLAKLQSDLTRNSLKLQMGTHQQQMSALRRHSLILSRQQSLLAKLQLQIPIPHSPPSLNVRMSPPRFKSSRQSIQKQLNQIEGLSIPLLDQKQYSTIKRSSSPNRAKTIKQIKNENKGSHTSLQLQQNQLKQQFPVIRYAHLSQEFPIKTEESKSQNKCVSKEKENQKQFTLIQRKCLTQQKAQQSMKSIKILKKSITKKIISEVEIPKKQIQKNEEKKSNKSLHRRSWKETQKRQIEQVLRKPISRIQKIGLLLQMKKGYEQMLKIGRSDALQLISIANMARADLLLSAL